MVGQVFSQYRPHLILRCVEAQQADVGAAARREEGARPLEIHPQLGMGDEQGILSGGAAGDRASPGQRILQVIADDGPVLGIEQVWQAPNNQHRRHRSADPLPAQRSEREARNRREQNE